MDTLRLNTEVSPPKLFLDLRAEMSGPLFLIPGLIVALSVTGQSLKPEQQTEMIRYLLAMRRPEGGWGLCVSLSFSLWTGPPLNFLDIQLPHLRYLERS